MTSKTWLKTFGRILEVLGVPILIMVAVLLKMPNEDLGTIGVLLFVGVCTFFTGLIFSHLPQKTEEEETEKEMIQTKKEIKGIPIWVIALALIAVIGTVVALTTWTGTITWSLQSKQFTVWDSLTGGSELVHPYLSDLGIITAGLRTFNFYLENDGNVDITIAVQNEHTSGSGGCTISWSSMSISVPKGTTRVLVTLMLSITNTDYYSWDFAISA